MKIRKYQVRLEYAGERFEDVIQACSPSQAIQFTLIARRLWRTTRNLPTHRHVQPNKIIVKAGF